ncbi:dermonecrotic toxin domain-containing protein [Pseudomonas yamanorum]
MTTEPDQPEQADERQDLPAMDLARIRHNLMRRLNASTAPSRFINDLHAAHGRCTESGRQLRRIMHHAPRIQRLVRGVLREHFSLEPDNLLFNVAELPGQPGRVDSLTERAMALLHVRVFPLNINQFTRLSIQGEPASSVRLTPREILNRVNALDLPARISVARAGYWEGLSPGSALSRTEHWVQLQQDFFADKALLAHALCQLSDHGLALVMGLVDAPTPQARRRAGGAWARLHASELMWGPVPLGGALHLCRRGADWDLRQVVYLPGAAQGFYEFASWVAMQRDLPALIVGLGHASLPLLRQNEWATEPYSVSRGAELTVDALRHSALAQVQVQADNEWACLDLRRPGGTPPGLSLQQRLHQVERARRPAIGTPLLNQAIEQLLAWDHSRRAREVTCGLLHPGMAVRTRESLVQRYERGVLTLLDTKDLLRDRPPYEACIALQTQWQQQVSAVSTLLEDQEAQLAGREFWLHTPAGSAHSRAAQLLSGQRNAMLHEAHLQRQLGLISEANLDALIEALDKGDQPRRCRVLSLSFGQSRQPLFALHGVFVVTTPQGLSQPALPEPVLLQVPGKDGGLQAFTSLDELSASLDASLKSPDGSALWHCVGRDQRRSARTLIRGLGADAPVLVYFQVLEGNLLSERFQAYIRQVQQDLLWVDGGGRPFSEVSDIGLARTLLSQELGYQLQVPDSAARAVALANISVLRLAAAHVKALPEWLAGAGQALRKRYQRQWLQQLASSAVLEQQLALALPSLESFARTTLIERLRKDGLHPQLDIDEPFLDMPDDVSTHWESHPQRPAGDSGVRVVVSPQRNTYSLLQLALHNLDAEAPWTELRLHYSRYLGAHWARHLPAKALIELISSLDVAGQYEQLVTRAFYPAKDETPALPPALVERPLNQQARTALFSATQQGLSTAGQSLFATALAARTLQDLQKNGHALQLCFVHLAALTLKLPRHVAGMLLIHDQVSAVTLLYWPQVKGHAPLTEHASLAAAMQVLMGLAARPENRAQLALQIASGWEEDALASYPVPVSRLPWTLDWRAVTPSLNRGFPVSVFDGFMWTYTVIKRWFALHRQQPATTLAETEQEIGEQITQDPRRWLDITCTTGSDFLQILAHGQLLGLQRDVRAVANSRRALLDYRQLRLGEQSEARVRGLLSFIPGVSIGVNLYELLLAARRAHHSGDPADAVAAGFATFVLVTDVALFLMPQGKASPRLGALLNRVRHRQRVLGGGVGNLRLPSTSKPFKGLGALKKPPVAEEAVTLHGPVNKGSHVRGGEQFILDGDSAYPVYRRKGEQNLRLKKPGNEGQDELLLYIEQPGEWLLRADAPEPRPGPSSGIHRPWEAARAGTEWVAPVVPHTERLARQPMLASSHWQAWGRGLEGPGIQEISPSRRLYRIQGAQSYDAVMLGDKYYELLPNGSTAPEGVIFLKQPELPPVTVRDELTRWMLPGQREQPIPATFGADQLWTPRVPLFTRPIADYVGDAFPGLTPASRYFVTTRLLEIADTGRSMTATRMLNIRATLDEWLPSLPEVPGQTDDLFRMLRPLARRQKLSVNIGREGKAPVLERVDFVPVTPIASEVLNKPAEGSGYARPNAAQHAVLQVLERQGFAIKKLHKSSTAGLYNLSCTHPKSNNLYYVLTRWNDSSNVRLNSGRRVQLSDAWFRYNGEQQAHTYAPVIRALDEGRLVRIIAGLQQIGQGNPVTVFFAKMERF